MGNKNNRPVINFVKKLENNLTPVVSNLTYYDYTEKSDLIIPNNPYYQTSFNSPAIYLTKSASLPTQPTVEHPEEHSEEHPEEHNEPLPDVKEYTLNNRSIFIILPVLLVGFVAVYYFYTKNTHQITH
jgi:hypothetical protein